VSGAAYTATVRVVDSFFNPVSGHPAENVQIQTTDLYDMDPTSTVANGQSQVTMALTFRTAGTHTATAVDTNALDAGTTWLSSLSPNAGSFTVVPGSAAKLQVLADGEIARLGSPRSRRLKFPFASVDNSCDPTKMPRIDTKRRKYAETATKSSRQSGKAPERRIKL